MKNLVSIYYAPGNKFTISYPNKIYKNKTHLQPKNTRLRRTTPGKALECTQRLSGPQNDQAPVMCPRVFGYGAKAEIVSKTKLSLVYWWVSERRRRPEI